MSDLQQMGEKWDSSRIRERNTYDPSIGKTILRFDYLSHTGTQHCIQGDRSKYIEMISELREHWERTYA